jgi:enoyl-CoA hydratase
MRASFSKAEINIGIIPTFGGTQRLPRNVGRKAAIELILTGRTFDSDASIDDGLAIEEAAFARIVPTHDAREGVAAFLEKRPPSFLGR